MLPLFLTTSSKIPFSSKVFPLYRQIFKCKLPSPMCPYPITNPPISLRAFSTNSFHLRMLKEMSYLCTSPSLFAASAMSYLICHIPRYYFSLVDIIESSKSGIELKNSSTSSVVSSSNKRWSVSFTGITEGWMCRMTERYE
jgi:hypothetical protein